MRLLHSADSAEKQEWQSPFFGLRDLDPWRAHWQPEEWRELLEDPEDEDAMTALRNGTARGRPLGSDSFISKLGRALGRRLRPLRIDRRKKR